MIEDVDLRFPSDPAASGSPTHETEPIEAVHALMALPEVQAEEEGADEPSLELYTWLREREIE